MTGDMLDPKKWQHDDVIKWKHFPRYWPFVWGIHRSRVNSPHKGQWRGALMFLWSAPWINERVTNRQAGDLRRHRAHYDIIVMNNGRVTFILWQHVGYLDTHRICHKIQGMRCEFLPLLTLQIWPSIDFFNQTVIINHLWKGQVWVSYQLRRQFRTRNACW